MSLGVGDNYEDVVAIVVVAIIVDIMSMEFVWS